MSFGIGRGVQVLAEAVASVIALVTKPARELTSKEAFDLLMYLVSIGEITLDEPIKTDSKGQVISPKPGQQVKVRTSLAGVDFLQASGANKGRNGSAGAHKTASFQPTPAFAIVLHRFAQRLRDKWGATRIVWGGIGAGSGLHSLDCHMNGTCVDFYGATTSKGTFDVREDWYLRTVLQKDGKPHPLATNDNDRWGDDTQTFYRLSNLKEPIDPGDALTRDFFLDVYTFVSEQCMFGSLDISPAAFRSGSPMKAGYTHHPDYPITQRRRAHNDHVHFQIGPAILKA